MKGIRVIVLTQPVHGVSRGCGLHPLACIATPMTLHRFIDRRVHAATCTVRCRTHHTSHADSLRVTRVAVAVKRVQQRLNLLFERLQCAQAIGRLRWVRPTRHARGDIKALIDDPHIRVLNISGAFCSPHFKHEASSVWRPPAKEQATFQE